MLDKVGKGMATVGVVGLVALAASLTAPIVGAWDYAVGTTSYTTTGVPSSSNQGSPSTQAMPGQYTYDTALLTVTNEQSLEAGTVVFSIYAGSTQFGRACVDGTLGSYHAPAPIQTTSSISVPATSSGTKTENASSLSATTNPYFEIPSGAVNGTTYYWIATFHDTSENTTWTSPCGDEQVTVDVTLPTLSVSTLGSTSSLESPTSISDSASVTNWGPSTTAGTVLAVDSSATATVTFNLFKGTGCSTGLLESLSTALTDSGMASRTFTAPSAAGPYEWQAEVVVNLGSHSGFSPIGPFYSGCGTETLSVQASDGLSTVVSGSPALTGTAATYGTSIWDTATVTGGYQPTGTVTFDLYNNASCTGTPVYVSSPAIQVSGGQAVSAAYTVDSAGTWEWTASYSGDQYNVASSSNCGQEPVTVGLATPSVTTVTSNGSSQVVVGSDIADSANVTNSTNGTTNNSSGNVYFNLFAPGDPSCTDPAIYTNEQALAVGVPYSTATSDAYLVRHLGTYNWTAQYAGDGNDLTNTSACGSEGVDVVKASPTIITINNDQAVEGSSVTDEAEITGGYHADYHSIVTFTLFRHDTDGTCWGQVGSSSTGNVNYNGDAYSAGVTVLSPGEYFWQASYSGNRDNNPAGPTNCGSEVVWVCNHTPTISTVPVTPVTTAEDNAVSDSATLANFYANPYNSNHNGVVQFKLFGPSAAANDCQWGEGGDFVTASGWIAVQDVVGTYGATFTKTLNFPLLPGTYYWEAVYSDAGAPFDNWASSGCGEPTVVQANTPSVSTTPSSGGAIGATLTDTAVVTPVITPSSPTDPAEGSVANGTPDSVHFELFLNDPTCSVTADLVNDFGSFYQAPGTNSDGSSIYTVSVPSTGYKSIANGTYYWDVIFTGDTYNNTVSSCGEPVTISTPAGSVLAASIGTPVTGADLFGPGLAGAIAMLLGGLLLIVGRRALRVRVR
ncbi:MAG: hypothetical protein WBZ07_02585 [Candidatus Dormiibacterota bacterium]